MSEIILAVVYGHYNTDPLNTRFFASNNLAFLRTLFALGGFDKSFRTAEGRNFAIVDVTAGSP